MRYVALILLTVFLASGLVVLVDTRTEPVLAVSALRGPDKILGAPRYSQATVEVCALYRLQPLYHEDYSDLLQASSEEEHSA
jgi:hypothetical protein